MPVKILLCVADNVNTLTNMMYSEIVCFNSFNSELQYIKTTGGTMGFDFGIFIMEHKCI